MISITTTSVRSNSLVILRGYRLASKIRDAAARINKTPTLDGGVVVIHNGFVEGDRLLDIQLRASETIADNLWELFTSQTFVNIAIPDGVYSGVIARLRVDRGDIKARIELQSELT